MRAGPADPKTWQSPLDLVAQSVVNEMNLKKLALAREVEDALKNYLGTDSFPTEQWPALALAFAEVVVRSGAVVAFDDDSYRVEAAAAELVRSMGQLDNAIADLVGL